MNGSASLHERRDAMQFRHGTEFADGVADEPGMMGNVPDANIMNNMPFVNILPFGMCQSPANPAVAAATAAALGVLTPMPCTPMTAAP